MFDQTVIEKYIPHRPPFLLIDQVIKFSAYELVKSTLLLDPYAWYFKGHFPHNPIFPGVLSLEFMGQTAAFLMTYSSNQSWDTKNIYLLSIDNAKFRHAAKPNDQLLCTVKLLRQKAGIFKLHGQIYADTNMICSADCMLMMAE